MGILTDIAAESDFSVFRSVVDSGGKVKGICAPGCANYSRSQLEELNKIVLALGAKGLLAIAQEIEDGRFKLKPELEDIHMAIESRLLELVGEVAGKLHTARSRNDQVALDMRLFTKEAISETIARIRQ